MGIRILVFAIIVFSSILPALGQETFKFTEKPFQQQFFSGIPVCVADFNGDFVDDLLVVDQSKKIWLGINSGKAVFIWKDLQVKSNIALWSVSAADLDRNGFNDIVLGADQLGIFVLYNDGIQFKKEWVDASAFFAQGASFYDINKDGWLDFSICNDNEKSRVFENKSGKLWNNESWIDLSLPNKANEAGNYGILWSDFDQDGDGDLYISKCRAGVTDTTDPRRINLFYLNENGVFSEKGTALGVDDHEQSWMAVTGDINGDGLNDLLVGNHYGPSKVFMQRADHSFEDFTLASGFKPEAVVIQFALRDWDNDADLDILLTGSGTELWLNDGEGHFSQLSTNLGEKPLSSLAVGDLNSDGYLDLYASYAYLLNEPNNRIDRAWINPGGTNHYVQLGLHGIQSNLNGIGCRIFIYAGGKKQFREVQSGESFGIQNSLNLHFGLNDSKSIDSLVIYWPSGIRQVFNQLDVDQFYLITEGKCIRQHPEIFPTKDSILCNNQIIEIFGSSSLQNILWNTGANSQKLNIDSAGVYFYTHTDSSDCYSVSENFTLLIDPVEKPRLNINYQKILCAGDVIELSVPEFDQKVWWDGNQDSIRLIRDSGLYFASVKGVCQTYDSDTLEVLVQDPVELLQLKGDTLTSPGMATITSDNPNTFWFNTLEDSVPVFTGPQYQTPLVDKSRSYWAQAFQIGRFKHSYGGMKSPVYEGGAYPAAFLNPKMLFTCYRDFILDSVTIYTDTRGKREIMLLDKMEATVATKEIYLEAGLNRVYLGFLCKGSNVNYSLTTNPDTNKLYYGNIGPRLERSNKGFIYPFFMQDLCRITSSDYGDSYFYHFFDWAVRPADQLCFGEKQEVKIVFQPVSTKDLGLVSWTFDQTSSGIFRLSHTSRTSVRLKVYDLHGKLLHSGDVKDGESINLSNLPSSVYLFYGVDSYGNTRTLKKILK
ncbi:MAG: VCBS repeat-containing protein [Saprospiraceae bacterium]|nr:VCBS repeat-containing protein [Saprospiraceae bacterium]